MPEVPRWQFAVDRGGTFTDCLGRDPKDGRVRVVKVLSDARAPLTAIRQLLELRADEPIPACDIRMGTTLATNALLEREGARTGLIITRGFADLLVIGDTSRPDIFALAIERPAPVCEAAVEVDARAAPSGTPLARTDLARLREELTALRTTGVESLAVVVIHGYAAPQLEAEIATVAHDLGFSHVSCSHEVAPQIGMLARGDTTAVDAYLTPLLRAYVASLRAELPGSTLRFMQSSGGLTDAERFRGRDAILSGPAGGVVACARLADARGLAAVIGFDMGGTSTDVCRYAGRLERSYESSVGGVRLRTPMMAVHTVAAGGGSICAFDGDRFMVGPRSAGATPGPLAYGRPEADALTLTDVNIALGRLPADRFPFPLARDRVDAALSGLSATLAAAGHSRSPEAIAHGYFTIALENMAQAIRAVSVARGYDVRNHALVVFGGAGGQHACGVAARLGIRRVLVHPRAGVLSAEGIGLADLHWHGESDAGRTRLTAAKCAELGVAFASLAERGIAALRAEGAERSAISVHRHLDLRYGGTQTPIGVEFGAVRAMVEAFEAAHRREFGYARPDHPIECVTVRVEVVAAGHGDAVPPPVSTRRESGPHAKPRRADSLWVDSDGGRWVEVAIYDREDLPPGSAVTGPAIVVDDTTTVVVDPNWTLEVDEHGVFVLADAAPRAPLRVTDAPDPVALEIMGNRFMAIAQEMGTVLRRTALSTNIRERLDFSCAVFDAAANLVANAPHMPVHLGAMGETVAAVARAHPNARAGDVFATNDPSAGGSHLPDITVVTPVFVDDQLSFYVASRGHHADIGGSSPGSMPADSTRIEDEGVVLTHLPIVSEGRFAHADVMAALRGGPHPARQPEQNLADLEAQVAANHAGVRLLRELVAEVGRAATVAAMGHVQDHAARAVAKAVARVGDGPHAFQDCSDEGLVIAVTLTNRDGRLVVDFSGTSPSGPHNLNAPRAVTVAAVLYVLRVLCEEPIPLNQGCLRVVDLRIPSGSLLDPEPERAVAGGNVETAQRIVDVLLGALGRKAASQGTMNNLTFGDGQFGYYETIAGGEGASATAPGCSGVQTHMTNTRITDPEILESRFGVRLHRFELRRGSGGAGAHRGGEGLVREIEFLGGYTLNLLSDRRSSRPFGIAGGDPGVCGRNTLSDRELPGRASASVAPGDRIVIETPGGGGYGRT